ncbi:MAG: haloalkane dehalogenase [Rhodospirillales bacterium]
MNPRAAALLPEQPYASHFVTVKDARLHYLDKGEGQVFLFLHGNPTSSYLWRNVMPHLEPLGRVVAPDLPGFGRSEKPQIDYRLQSHVAYIEGLIDALGLSDIVLVIHDWGSAIGLDIARRRPGLVKAVAFMEALVPPTFPMASIEGMGRAAGIFGAFRTPEKGESLILEKNAFVEKVLPGSILRPLSEAEMAHYRAPFATPESRLPTLVWPREIPIAGEPARNVEAVEAYGAWLRESPVPKLALYCSPGALMPPEAARWMQANFKACQARFVGYGSHFIQEDEPEAIGRNIADWYAGLSF